jgi:putative transposase
MIAFIDEHRAVHGVEPICRVLPIAPSTYHAHAARRVDPGKLPARARRDITLKTEIHRVYEENFASMASGRSGGSFSGKGPRLLAAP